MPPRYGLSKDGLASAGHLHPGLRRLSICRTRPATNRKGRAEARPRRGRTRSEAWSLSAEPQPDAQEPFIDALSPGVADAIQDHEHP